MAKKKKENSSKCPEPLNSIIDFIAITTYRYIAMKKRKKNGYRKTRIDPYAATGAAVGLGLVEDTEDLLKLGCVLGVMGAFDDDEEHYNHNKYAWRMNCLDGSNYGIYPENYETREEYHDDLLLAMGIDDMKTEGTNDYNIVENDTMREVKLEYTYCKVSRLDNGVNDYYLPGNFELNVGDLVMVPTEAGKSKAVVLFIQSYSEDELPKSLNEIEEILEKC